MSSTNRSSGGEVSASAARRSFPVRRRAGRISATGRLPRVMVTLSPRSIASSRSENLREASVAVIVRTGPHYLIIRYCGNRPGPLSRPILAASRTLDPSNGSLPEEATLKSVATLDDQRAWITPVMALTSATPAIPLRRYFLSTKKAGESVVRSSRIRAWSCPHIPAHPERYSEPLTVHCDRIAACHYG